MQPLFESLATTSAQLEAFSIDLAAHNKFEVGTVTPGLEAGMTAGAQQELIERMGERAAAKAPLPAAAPRGGEPAGAGGAK